jgi:hypothetical protein
VWAAAEDDLDRDKGCDILENCASDEISAAKRMKAECNNMMEQANEMIRQGMRIKTEGQMLSDQDLVTEGDALVLRGKAMLEQAKKMDEACTLIITEAENAKKKARTLRGSGTKDEGSDRPNRGDKIPQ